MPASEIVKQLAKYIYGEKPIPPKGSVTGTVSTTSIPVKVTEGSKTTSFTATVNMNGATMPAPAIISYGAGASAPSGVARITFTAVEASGGSGAKTGPFFTYYGSNHPAGYMVAQAWQVSRIIDLLEQNPGVIDPYHVGVTGCSRNGKGAFAGGVFDNRIALTIPCESGIGGTPALRLKEQLIPVTAARPSGRITPSAMYAGCQRWHSGRSPRQTPLPATTRIGCRSTCTRRWR